MVVGVLLVNDCRRRDFAHVRYRPIANAGGLCAQIKNSFDDNETTALPEQRTRNVPG